MIAWGMETLMATTLLMLAVLLLRNPVRRAFGPAVAYALWALPVLRLGLPPLPGDWRLSGLLTPLIEKTMAKGMTVGVLNPDRLPASVTDHAIATIDLNMAAAPVRMVIVPPVATADGPSVLLLVLIAWAIGAVIFLGYHLITYHRFCRRLDSHTRRRHRMAGHRIEVIETDATGGPLAFGIWRKVVAFPSDFAERYDEDERDLALAHELTHHARGDLIANWVALVVLALHWFNPIAWRAFRAFRADQEMACDALVLAGRDAAFAHAYGRAIVKSAHGGAVSAACHLHTINELKGRLRMLSIGKKSRARIVAGSAGVLVLTVTALGLTASGTQAAERMRAKVRDNIGLDLPVLVPAAPLAPAAPQVASAAGPVPVAVPMSAANAAPVAAPAPPAPPAPPAAAAPGTRVDRQVIIVKGDGGKVERRVKVIFRDKDGKITTRDTNDTADLAEIADIHNITVDVPEVIDGKCSDAKGDDKSMVRHDSVNGKHRIIICRNRIEKVTREATAMAANSADIERNAYRSALEGLRGARANMTAKGGANAEALKAIDEAIAEVESDLAKVN